MSEAVVSDGLVALSLNAAVDYQLNFFILTIVFIFIVENFIDNMSQILLFHNHALLNDQLCIN